MSEIFAQLPEEPIELEIPAQILGSSFATSTENEVFYCIYSTPVRFDDTQPTNYNQPFTFKELNCYSAVQEKITDGTNTFYLSKDISYFDFLIVAFLMIFTLFFIFDFIFRFIYKIKVNFRH